MCEQGSDELEILWEHNDSLISCISANLESFAEEASNERAGLISPEVKETILSFPADAKARARSLLMSVEKKIKGQPNYFHRLLSLLRGLPNPEFNAVASKLLSAYGELLHSPANQDITPLITMCC